MRFLQATFDFQGPELVRAIGSTFARRQTAISTTVPTALSDAFSLDPGKQAQWRAFLSRSRLESGSLNLENVVASIHDFLMPCLLALARDESFDHEWPAGGPWRPATAAES